VSDCAAAYRVMTKSNTDCTAAWLFNTLWCYTYLLLTSLVTLLHGHNS